MSQPAVLSREETCRRLDELMDAERCLDALEVLNAHADWREWEGADTISVSRVVRSCGGGALSRRITSRAWRKSPRDKRLAYSYAVDRARRHGPFEALRWLDLNGWATPGRIEDETDADFLALRARVLSVFRDFTGAEALLAQALEAFPRSAWLLQEKSDLLRQQDRYAEALEVAREMFALQPRRYWSVRTYADLLQLTGRDDEALEILRRAVESSQNGYFAMDLCLALDERGDPVGVLEAVETARRRLPLSPRSDLAWMDARRCDALQRLGRHEEAREAALAVSQGQKGYYQTVAERLASPVQGHRRVHLPVGFVRQHHMTCGPASLAAVAGFWGRPVDHLELAREICYDGTADHVERNWLEENGWVVREFRVDMESAKALLDWGCPFVMVTTGVGSAHLQTVIGYDSLIGTILVRDPYQRVFSEWDAEATFREQELYGPRGMVFVPPTEASRLEGLTLPDEKIADHRHDFRRGLFLHDRPRAAQALKSLEELAPEHPKTLFSRMDLARYDGNPADILPPLEALRGRYPDDGNQRLAHLDLLEELGRPAEARELLEKFGSKLNSPYSLQRRRALRLLEDARTAARAARILRRLLGYTGSQPEYLSAWADCLWGEGRHAEATDVYRLAACAGDKTECYWRSYSIAARQQGREQECFALLRARFARWGDQSAQPARTLVQALDELDLDHEALEVLAEARRRRPDDAEFALFAVPFLARHQRGEEARALLESIRPRCVPIHWLRTAARLAERDFDHAAALALWRQVLALDATDVSAHDSAARLLRITEGPAAPLAHLAAACEGLPHLFPLQRLRIEWLRSEPPDVACAVIDGQLALHPENAWLLRERAFTLRLAGRPSEGLADARRAALIEPRVAASHCALSRCLRDVGNLGEAREAARRGIALDVDSTHLFQDLLEACEDGAGKREAIRFIAAEILRQNSRESACLDYLPHARKHLDNEELLADLRAFLARQPEHWATRSCLSSFLDDLGRPAEALEVALENTRKFPLIPRVWLDLSVIHQRCGRTDEEAEALGQALRLNPAWGYASRLLSVAQEHRRQPAEAEQTLRRAISLSPTDCFSHGFLADLLWRTGRPREAIAAISQALRCDPEYRWAWDCLDTWSRRLDGRSEAVAMARELTEKRPGDASCWVQLARLLLSDGEDADQLPEVLGRIERLDPCHQESRDIRARWHMRHKRWMQAREACMEAGPGGRVPVPLLIRAACVTHASGKAADAIAELRSLLETHADNSWGHSLLVEWLSDEDRKEEALEMARRLVRLNPRNAVAHGWIAHLQRRLGNTAEAKQAFRLALEQHPEYDYAAYTLLEMHTADGEHQEADRVLAHIQAHFSRADHLSRLGQTLVKRGQARAAADQLATLARFPEAEWGHLERVAEALREGRHLFVLSALGRKLVALDDTHAESPRVWLMAKRDADALSLLLDFHLVKTSARHRPAFLHGYLRLLLRRESALGLLLLRLLRGRELRGDDNCWETLAQHHLEKGSHRAGLRWLDEASPRKSMRALQLENTASHRLALGRTEGLIPLLREWASLAEADTLPVARAWLALELALAGDPDAARETLATVDPEGCKDARATYLHKLGTLLLGHLGRPAEEQTQHFLPKIVELEALGLHLAGTGHLWMDRKLKARARRRLATTPGARLRLLAFRLFGG